MEQLTIPYPKVHSEAAPRLAAGPAEVIVCGPQNRESCEQEVAVEMSSIEPRGGQHGLQAQSVCQSGEGRVHRMALSRQHDFLQGCDVGLELFEQPQNPLWAYAPVPATPTVNVIGQNANPCRRHSTLRDVAFGHACGGERSTPFWCRSRR